MDSMCTIICGVLVFILSQLFMEYVLKPIQEYKKLKGKIAYDLVYYANYYSNPQAGYADGGEKLEEASIEFRKDAAEILAFPQANMCDKFSIPSKQTFIQVETELIGLSNGCNSQGEVRYNKDQCEKIRKLLMISD